MYRPFTKKFLYFDGLLNQRRYKQHLIFPFTVCDGRNPAICCSAIGSTSPFQALMTRFIPDLHFAGDTQCFPYYAYTTAGRRTENVTNWALVTFQRHYRDASISKKNIFNYTYAVLYHSIYRDRFAENLRLDFPKIPFAPNFWHFARAGERLSELHSDFEQQRTAELKVIEKPNQTLDWRVKKLKLSADKTAVIYNDFITLSQIPADVYNFRLGSRSALEWLVDQFQVSTDKRTEIQSDPNRGANREYILNLIGSVVAISIETVEIVKHLPTLGLISDKKPAAQASSDDASANRE